MNGRKQDQLGATQTFRVVLQFGGVNQGVSKENGKKLHLEKFLDVDLPIVLKFTVETS